MSTEYKISPNPTYHEITLSSKWEKYKSEKYMQYRKLWSELPISQTVPAFPLHLDIETTTICNLRCPMCARTRSMKKNEFTELGIIKFDDFKNLIDQGIEGGIYSIKMNYLGEPLVHPDVVQQVKYAKDRGVVDVMFNTNGVLLEKEMSADLLEAGIDKLFLSFDSPYKEDYEKVRVGAEFEDVLANIRYFYKLKTEKYPHVQVRVSMVMLDENLKVREDYIELFRDTADAIGFDECRDTEDESIKPVIDGFICSQLFQRMFLRQSGDVIVCCGDNHSEYIVGNWKEELLKDIWHSTRYRAMRSAHKSGKYHSIPVCSKCTIPTAQISAMERKVLVGEKV